MTILITSKTAAGANNRRSFLQKLGVGISTALGSAVAVAKPEVKADLSAQIARLEAEQALRSLQRRYEEAMDAAQADAVLALFTDDVEVVFNGGVFSGREQGVSRLYRQHFAAGNTGKRMQQAPGFELTAAQQQEQLTVALDMQTATAVVPYSIQVGRPIESDTSLASMARAQGEGIHTWWEGGVYELSYVKAAAGEWKIQRLVYNTLSRADYRAGRSYAKPIAVPTFTTSFPDNAEGPDRLA